MLSNFSQYSPQGLSTQFPGLQAAGFPSYSPMSTGQFGLPGLFGGSPGFGADSGQQGHVPQQFFGAQTPWGAQNPFAQNPFVPFGANPVQQIVPVLAQIAQQVAVQSAVTQQLGTALHQLAHHLATQSFQSQQGIGGGQPFGGFNPQAQGWGANRSATIQ
jgi:hypothetical protein